MIRVLFLLAVLGAGFVIADDTPPKSDPTIETPEEFDSHITPLVAGIRKSTSLVVYEGLPHQLWEHESLQNELKAKKTLKRHGFPFYEAPVKLNKEDAEKLAAICGDVKNFEPWSGEKLCGEYHPDWCVELQSGTDVYRVFICFGCSEARLYGPMKDVYCDLTKANRKKFAEILKPLHTQRPLRK